MVFFYITLSKPDFHGFITVSTIQTQHSQAYTGWFMLLTAAPEQLPRPQGLETAGPNEHFP